MLYWNFKASWTYSTKEYFKEHALSCDRLQKNE